jgi:predicted RNase H-like nuclease
MRHRSVEYGMRYNFRVADTRFIGIDLAWREGNADLVANETGVAVIDGDGQILDAGWTRGVEQTIGWADRAAGDGDAVIFVDAPPVVRNQTGQQLCEMQVGQRYGRWKVSANTTNIHSPRLAGVQFLRLAGCQAGDIPSQQRAAERRPLRLRNLPVRRAGRRARTGL